jgi:ferredoxin--NADP+ reductase
MSSEPLRVAVLGSGPSGFYAADALIKNAGRPVRIDMFDRLPTPYGLVRGGVAPDHQSIKAVIKVYDRTAATPGFRFFGNVTAGRDLVLDDLAAHYHAWVWAVGNEKDKRLGIPGEDLVGSHSATDFVGWYNGHPDHVHHTFDLSCDRVAVVGVGNVAMDVTRVLAKTADALASTDIAAHAVSALRNSAVREIVVLGRRGVAQAAFSPQEIKEIGELADVDLVVRPEEIAVDELSAKDLEDANAKKNLEYLQQVAARGPQNRRSRVTLRLLCSCRRSRSSAPTVG